MRIQYSKQYIDGFRLLTSYEQKRVLRTLELFLENPNHHSLSNHPLRPPKALDRSISVSDNMRIIFRKKGDYISVVLLDVGNHDRVYGKL